MVKSIEKVKCHEKEKQHHIKEYTKLKKENPDRKVVRKDFCNATGIKKARIEQLWGTYGKFKVQAESEFIQHLSKRERALLTEVYKVFDITATKDQCIDDLRKVQKDRQLEFITRTIYRNEGKYSDTTWNRYFGTFQEFRRQAGLELSRQQSQLEKHIAKHASNDHYSDYFTTEVLPYYNKYEKQPKDGRIKTIMVISDVHDKECDEFTLSVFVDTCIKKQPDVIVFNGDIFDFYDFSRFS
ncbi:MAG: metallophosphoesterase, partial [Candidatus Heimdallarchaeota archaeon]|nr:metallophosphoesterase [Candidatus Heimdallarchaeota archaeon]